jgi:membrane-associated phospholipid phosphatase
MNGAVTRRVSAIYGVSRDFAREWLLPARMAYRWWPPAVGLVYIATIAALGGLRPDHVMLGLLGFLDVYNHKTRSFLRTFLPFIATGAIFDSMRYFHWHLIEGRVHTAGPYLLDRSWFGVGGLTLNEYFAVHHWVVVDLVTGFAYLTYVAEFLGLAMLLFFRGHAARAATFARCFLVVNVMGFITYLIYPAAPPWYVAHYGFGPAAHIQPSPAAAHRFDQLLGTHVFDKVYGHNIDVFGAIPSLHSAYPLIAAVLAFRIAELRWARFPAIAFSALMCFSAIYLQHHYVIDVVLGLTYGAVAVVLVSGWERWRVRT